MNELNWHDEHAETLSRGARIADAVTSFMGSWKFIGSQTVLMGVWVIYNTWATGTWLLTGAFDPFPFVFLNLFMSAQAAYSTPFIMMSQNRQGERDRVQAQHQFDNTAEILRILKGKDA